MKIVHYGQPPGIEKSPWPVESRCNDEFICRSTRQTRRHRRNWPRLMLPFKQKGAV